MKEKTFGISLSLTQATIDAVNGYMNKTRQNFSKTLNIIVKEWDEFSIALEKYKRAQLEQQTTTHLNNIKKAQVVK